MGPSKATDLILGSSSLPRRQCHCHVNRNPDDSRWPAKSHILRFLADPSSAINFHITSGAPATVAFYAALGLQAPPSPRAFAWAKLYLGISPSPDFWPGCLPFTMSPWLRCGLLSRASLLMEAALHSLVFLSLDTDLELTD